MLEVFLFTILCLFLLLLYTLNTIHTLNKSKVEIETKTKETINEIDKMNNDLKKLLNKIENNYKRKEF